MRKVVGDLCKMYVLHRVLYPRCTLMGRPYGHSESTLTHLYLIDSRLTVSRTSSMQHLSLQRPGIIPNYYFACHFIFFGLVFTISPTQLSSHFFVRLYATRRLPPRSPPSILCVHILYHLVCPCLFCSFPAVLCVCLRYRGVLADVDEYIFMLTKYCTDLQCVII